MQTFLFSAKPASAGDTLRALTIHQHWAWAIMQGHKRCENRCWTTPYRGPIVVHAGKSKASLEASAALIRGQGLALPTPEQLAFGALLGTVDLIDIVDVATARRRYQCGEWATGEHCWILRNPRPFAAPIPYVGALHLFAVSITSANTTIGGRDDASGCEQRSR